MFQLFRDALKHLSVINTVLLLIILTFFLVPETTADIIRHHLELTKHFGESEELLASIYILITVMCFICELLNTLNLTLNDTISYLCFNAWQTGSYCYIIACLVYNKLLLLPIDNSLVLFMVLISICFAWTTIFETIIKMYVVALNRYNYLTVHIVILVLFILRYLPFNSFMPIISP